MRERKLSDFEIGYIECGLALSNDSTEDPEGPMGPCEPVGPTGDESEGEPLDRNYDIGDFAPETLDRIQKDCQAFQELAFAELAESGMDTDLQGHNFWLTRCGHGTGFWDRDLGDLGDKLTELSDTFGECWMYVGDDGLIYIF